MCKKKVSRLNPRFFPECKVVDVPQVLCWTQIKLPFNPGTDPDISW